MNQIIKDISKKNPFFEKQFILKSEELREMAASMYGLEPEIMSNWTGSMHYEEYEELVDLRSKMLGIHNYLERYNELQDEFEKFLSIWLPKDILKQAQILNRSIK